MGELLTSHTGGIRDDDGLDNATFSYQWIRKHYSWSRIVHSPIHGATDSTYGVTAHDFGRTGSSTTLMVRVSFIDDAGNEETLTSEPFGPFSPAAPPECPEGGPEPVDVAVESVPIVVESTGEEYFVLYVGSLPVSVTLGGPAATTLTDRLSALPIEEYRVEKYLIADPGDVDGDCIDDITELQDPNGDEPGEPRACCPIQRRRGGHFRPRDLSGDG